MKKYTLSLFTNIFFVIILSAQSYDFKPSYYLDKNNDSIYVFIKDKNENKLSYNFEFKTEQNSISQSTVNAKDCNGFSFIGGEHYLSIFDSILNKNIFIRELAVGPLSLYSFSDSDPEIFFLWKNTSDQQYRLIKNEKIVERNGESYLREDTRYIGILNLLMQDCPEMAKKISTSNYNSNEIIKLVDSYNSCINPETEYKSKTKKTKFYYGPEIGINTYTNHQLHNTKYDSYPSLNRPGFTIGMSMDIKIGAKLFFDVAALYSQYHFEMEWNGVSNPYLHENVDFKFKYLDIPLLLRFNILSTKFTPIIYGGGIFGLMLDHEYIVESDHPALDGTYKLYIDSLKWAMVMGTGVSYDNKLLLKVGYFSSLFLAGANTKMTNNGIEVKVAYLF